MLNSAETSSTKLTLLALAEFADPEGRSCYPGIDALARLTSQSEKTCRRSLDSTDGRWFNRTPIKFDGRDWRGYSYSLKTPEGADTVTAPGRRVADTVTAAETPSSGHSVLELRTFEPRAAVTVSDELGKAPRKSNKGERRAPLLTYREWIESLHAGDDPSKAIPEGDPIFEFQDKAGISDDFLYLAWRWFGHRFRDDDRKYRDWRAVFRRCIREDWHRCWRKDNATGQLVLTTAGLQLQNELEAEEEAA